MTALTAFPEEHAKVQSCRDVITEHDHPPVATTFSWYDEPAEEGHGYLVIDVEPLLRAPKAHEGGLLLSDSRRAIWVRPDASVIAAAVATDSMLCHAMSQRAESARLNVITLSEMNLEYFRWVDRFLLPSAEGRWEHRVTADRFAGKELCLLGPGHNPQFPMIGLQNQASAGLWDRAWPATGSPETDAFKSPSRIYGLFGLAASQNPYTTDARADTEKVRAAVQG
ncbi:hypothetical protein KUM39_13700 [Streptomyces sp. J2-1]|uniref:hypothetical protein n=1 Tax=Streptomyces corallincola TaxID=2851888 RepID=UPI001C394C31|nr:hypothetical protein [Streptomyces corallincola]MBV2355412.1 hypothetical protein [Streptomyces corallincola]